MTRLSVLMVVKNEADRYLAQALAHATEYADDIFVYDDQSTDNSYEIASEYATAIVRPDSVPTFLKHEGRFRQAALDMMIEELRLQGGDWIHVLDADEFLVCEDDVRATIDDLTESARRRQTRALRVRIPTVWGGTVVDGILTDPVVRTDKFWNTLMEPRIWQYYPGAKFLDKAMACRNEPTYVRKFPMLDAPTLFNFHYGYAVAPDRMTRYDRYTNLENHGHHPKFIESINAAAPVKRWTGPWKPVQIPQIDLTEARP